MTTPAASKKDKHGHRTYAIPHQRTKELLDMPSWSRLKGLMYAGGLETWKLKKVAAAVAKSTALQMEAADPDTCFKAVEKALQSDTEAADVGTYVHSYTEKIDAGELEWEWVPPAAVGFVKAYEALRAEWQWEVVEAEVTIFNLVIGYAGSADRFMRIPGLAERLGLPAPDLDVFPLDIKTGKVHAEVALQLGAYANGEGIFEAPSKMDLGFTVREAQLEDDIRNGVGFDRINPRRQKWSEEAIKEAKAELEAEWWKAYAEHGKHRPMPKGLRRDVGVVVHLYSDPTEEDPARATAHLIPIRLDGNPMAGEVPATHVIDGLAALYKWGRRKDIIGEPVDREATAEAAPEVEEKPAKPAPQLCPTCGELDDFHAAGCAVVAPAPEPEPEPAPEPAPADPESQAIDTLERAGILEGAEVGNTEDDLIASDEDKRPYIEWLGDIARNRKHLLPALRASLDAEGLTKKLRQDTWSVGELRRWSNCAIAVERAAL